MFYAEIAHLYAPGAGVVEGAFQAAIRPAQGEIGELTFLVPEGPTITDVFDAARAAAPAEAAPAAAPPLVSLWRFDPDNRQLRVSLNPAQSRPFALVIRAQVATGRLPFEQAVGLLSVENAADQIGLLGIGTGSEVQLDSVNAGGLSPINLEDFPAETAAVLQSQIAGLTVLAWKSIEQEKEQLNLDPATERQVKNKIAGTEETIAERLKETFCHLLVPIQEGTGPIEWQSTKLQGENLVSRASKKLVTDQSMIPVWSAALLRMELDKWLWKDKNHIKTKDVWEYLAQYIYLPRLKDEQTLVTAIRDGVGSLTWKDFFAYASAVRDDGYYVGLAMGANPSKPSNPGR